VLQLDRELSRMEQKLRFPKRSMVLFGMSPSIQAQAIDLKLSLNGRVIAEHRLDQAALNSLRQGGQFPVWENNLNLGQHQFVIDVIDRSPQNTRPAIQQRINVRKRQARQVIGVQWVEPNRVNPAQFRWVEWPDYD
ncbi:MAG: hypothetical protein VXW65_05150, partial [Pseudomonadota bacterium]|nr:hypothetical protein [Pseudomonadota bacterium]